MQIKPEKIKETAFRKAMTILPRLVNNYEAGDYEVLGQICQQMCLVDEYCGRRGRKLRLNHEFVVQKYRSGVYAEMIALVIRDDSRAHKYTRKDVVKFIRGEFIHGDSDNRDHRRLVLHNFAFESDEKLSLEYAITWAFIIFPGIRSSAGNTDSHTPFVQGINFGDRKIEVTQLESIVINAVYEYLQALLHGKVHWDKLAITNDLDSFRSELGSEIVDALIKEWGEMQKWRVNKEIPLHGQAHA